MKTEWVKRTVLTVWAAAIILLAGSGSCWGQYSGGSGTEADPCQISTIADWQALIAAPADWDKHFQLTNDIDFGGIPLTPVAPDTSTSSGFQGTPFTGVFDGNGHVLRNATIDMSGTAGQDYVGLFGFLGGGGQIRDLGVEGVEITGYSSVGGLVGRNVGTITACYATGSVHGTYDVGGLVGQNYSGTITACYATGSVNGYDRAGGLVGYNYYYSGTITACYATGSVRGSFNIGGLVGLNSGTITDCYTAGAVTGYSNYAGGLVGYNDYGTITSCYATGSVNGYDRVGGLVGGNNGTITACYATGSVSGSNSSVGGLVGYNDSGTITSCYASGSVSGSNHYVGGLVGYNDYGTITASYATGSVSGSNHFVGGLVGENDSGTITACYATGSVNGSSYVGGLVGYNCYYYGTITACYATGSVNGYDRVGGLVGHNYGGTITACYATGSVSGSNHYVGGLVGYNSYSGIVTASFWDMDASGLNGSSAGKGLTTGQMKTMSIFQNAGWSQYAWVMEDGQDYPRLAWENTAGLPIPAAPPVPLNGAGTQNDPYQVQTPAEFALLSWHVSILDKHLRLTADIDLTGFLLYPIGDLGPFTGDFDGDGHIIRNAVIDQPTSDYVGLFDSIVSGGQIRDLGAEGVDITGRYYVGGLVGLNYRGMITASYATGSVSGYDSVGGLVGENYSGTITYCYAAGSVNGYDRVGGLAGLNNYYGTITACYATGSVSGSNYYVGGLVGFNRYGTITASYAAGDVSGDYYVGGLVGYNYQGKIIHCYSIGRPTGTSSVGGLCGYKDTGGGYADTGNFWDTQTSQTTTSAMGTGRTTAQMKTLSTFIDAGWDFEGEFANGTADIWTIEEGIDYPRFCWQLPLPPKTIYVAMSATGANDGTSWDNAFVSLQSALDVAEPNEQIWVAEGVYRPSERIDPGDPRTATFQLVNGAGIYGGFPNTGDPAWEDRDPDTYVTVLSGDLLGNDNPATAVEDLLDDPCRVDNCYHVFYHPVGLALDPNAILDGFTITAGSADGSWPHSCGGGMYNDSSSPTVRSCTFSDNAADDYGGGIYLGGLCNAVITHCEITANLSYNDGGGICLSDADQLGCAPVIVNCIIKNNSAQDNGGGIRCDDYSAATIRNCVMAANTGGDEGGGLACKWNGSSAEVENCTITGNRSDIGGAVYCQEGAVTLRNCILWGNTAGAGEEIALRFSDYGTSSIAVSYSDVEGGPMAAYLEFGCVLNWNTGNIDVNPNFAAVGYWDDHGTPADTDDDFWVNGDYHLQSQAGRWDVNGQTWVYDEVTSRCIDAGNPGMAIGDEYPDPENIRINMGAYGGTAEASRSPADWSLAPDVNNDGIVEIMDYTMVTGCFGQTGDNLPGDFNHDGTVDLLDLAYLAANWLKTTVWYVP